MKVTFGFNTYRLDEHNARDVARGLLSEMEVGDYISLDFVKEWVTHLEDEKQIDVAGVSVRVNAYEIADALDLWEQIRDERINEICDYYEDCLTKRIEWGFERATYFGIPAIIRLGSLAGTVYE